MSFHTDAASAEHVFKVQRKTMLDQIQDVVKAADASEGTKGLMKETAILEAKAIDQACFGMIFAVELLKERIDLLNANASELGSKVEGLAKLMASSANHVADRIDVSTKSTTESTNALTSWTKRLFWATISLGIAAIVAAGIQAHAIMNSQVQVVTVTMPSRP